MNQTNKFFFRVLSYDYDGIDETYNSKHQLKEVNKYIRIQLNNIHYTVDEIGNQIQEMVTY